MSRLLHRLFLPSGIKVSLGAVSHAWLACSILAVLLAACTKEDKHGKALESGALNPPWDSPAFTPRELDNLGFDRPDSLFFVFQVIALIDSLNGDRSTWSLSGDAVDTLTLAQMFDSAFVFPQTPAASIPYAYDDSYRDDTLYRHYYGNGLFTQDHPCAQTFVVSDPFLHPARWLKAGLKQAEIINALGTPAFTQQGVLRYFHRRAAPEAAPAGDSLPAKSEYDLHAVMEGMNFYFRSDSLFAVVLHKSQPCH